MEVMVRKGVKEGAMSEQMTMAQRRREGIWWEERRRPSEWKVEFKAVARRSSRERCAVNVGDDAVGERGRRRRSWVDAETEAEGEEVEDGEGEGAIRRAVGD